MNSTNHEAYFSNSSLKL